MELDLLCEQIHHRSFARIFRVCLVEIHNNLPTLLRIEQIDEIYRLIRSSGIGRKKAHKALTHGLYEIGTEVVWMISKVHSQSFAGSDYHCQRIVGGIIEVHHRKLQTTGRFTRSEERR